MKNEKEKDSENQDIENEIKIILDEKKEGSNKKPKKEENVKNIQIKKDDESTSQTIKKKKNCLSPKKYKFLLIFLFSTMSLTLIIILISILTTPSDIYLRKTQEEFMHNNKNLEFLTLSKLRVQCENNEILSNFTLEKIDNDGYFYQYSCLYISYDVLNITSNKILGYLNKDVEYNVTNVTFNENQKTIDKLHLFENNILQKIVKTREIKTPIFCELTDDNNCKFNNENKIIDKTDISQITYNTDSNQNFEKLEFKGLWLETPSMFFGDAKQSVSYLSEMKITCPIKSGLTGFYLVYDQINQRIFYRYNCLKIESNFLDFECEENISNKKSIIINKIYCAWKNDTICLEQPDEISGNI